MKIQISSVDESNPEAAPLVLAFAEAKASAATVSACSKGGVRFKTFMSVGWMAIVCHAEVLWTASHVHCISTSHRCQTATSKDIATPHLDLLHNPKLRFGEATLTATTICVAGFIWLGTRNVHGIFSFRLLQAKPLGVLLLAKIAWRVSLDEAGWINQPVQLTTSKDLQPKKLMV